MKKQVQYLSYLGVLALFLSVSFSLNAQTPQTQQPDAQSQQPAQQAPPDQAGQDNSDAQAMQKTGVQTFTGTIVKSSGKYMFQDAATDNVYDIDHQDEVQKFDGKKVTVHGTLDTNSKMIHIKPAD